MRTPIALLAGTALLLPAVVLATPAEAASRANPEITNCSTTKHGVKVRIKVRDEGRAGMNIRVSHFRATGNFEEPRVRATVTGIYREGKAPPPDQNGGQIGGGATAQGGITAYSFRTGPAAYQTDVSTTFKLRNGKRITLSCEVR